MVLHLSPVFFSIEALTGLPFSPAYNIVIPVVMAWFWLVTNALTLLVPVARGTFTQDADSDALLGPLPVYFALVAATVTTVFTVGYGAAYRAMSEAEPYSFSEPLSAIDAVYFSLTTLTTTGYGDIVAHTEDARLLVASQLAGAFLFGILVVSVVASFLTREARGAKETDSY